MKVKVAAHPEADLPQPDLHCSCNEQCKSGHYKLFNGWETKPSSLELVLVTKQAARPWTWSSMSIWFFL